MTQILGQPCEFQVMEAAEARTQTPLLCAALKAGPGSRLSPVFTPPSDAGDKTPSPASASTVAQAAPLDFTVEVRESRLELLECSPLGQLIQLATGAVTSPTRPTDGADRGP